MENKLEVPDLDKICKMHKYPRKMTKLLSEEVPDGNSNAQFKDEIVFENAKMIKEVVSDNLDNDDCVNFMNSDNIYVDKSLFIGYILHNENDIIITCLKGWGKSFNLSIFKAA